MESMRQLLRNTLGRSLEAMPALDRLRAAWPVACGKALAARGRIIAYEGALVTVAVDDASWLDQLRSMRAVLERELARIAAVPVRGIHFEGAADAPRRNGTPANRMGDTNR